MKKTILFISAFCLLVSGCTFYNVNSEEIVAGLAATAKKKEANDIAYLPQVNQPYDVIGHVSVNTERRNSFDEVLAKIKSQAAVIGGDAVTNLVNDSSAKKIARVRINYTATVIVLKDVPPTPAVTTPAP